MLGCHPDRTGVGYLALDLDVYKPEGALSYEIAEDLGWIVDTVAATTGRGGRHVLLSYDPTRWIVKSRAMAGKPIPGTTERFPGGFEIKAENGQIVVEPSVGDAGPYMWLDGQSPFDIPVAPAPESLLKIVGLEIDPETGTVVGSTSGPWSRYGPDQVHPATAEAVTILVEHFGGHTPIVVRTGPEPTVEIVRPNKSETGGRSATVGHVKPGLVKMFTDGWAPFEQGQVVDLPELRRLAGIVVGLQLTVPTIELPDGYRLWRPDDADLPAPELGPAAYHGPIGDYLRLVDGETEAHPAAVGAHLLAGFATMIGRGPDLHVRVGDAPLQPVGSRSSAPPRRAGKVSPKPTPTGSYAPSTPTSTEHTPSPGSAPGEMLVYEVRDPDPTDENDLGGVKDRIIQNAELSGTFKVCARDGSILGDHLRLAFDGAPMRHATRAHGVVVAGEHHVSIVGSITPPELLKLIDDVSRANGFANRFLFLWAEIGDLLPFGGNVDDDSGDPHRRARQGPTRRPRAAPGPHLRPPAPQRRRRRQGGLGAVLPAGPSRTRRRVRR